MPRSKTNPETFEAGKLPEILFDGVSYYVDGRMKEIWNVDNIHDTLDIDEGDIWEQLSHADQRVITFEFYGV